MEPLSINSRAPDIDLVSLDGERPALDGRLTLVIFFKTNCPTCQYAWPFYERLYSAYGPAGLKVFGISQHDEAMTAQFQKDYPVTFPLLIDSNLSATEDYAPDFVPTGFLLTSDRQLSSMFVAWNSEEFNRLSEEIATTLQVQPKQIIRPTENVIPFKPG